MKDQSDPICECGYKASQHETVEHACQKFKRSAFFNQQAQDMAVISKYTKSRPLDVRHGR